MPSYGCNLSAGAQAWFEITLNDVPVLAKHDRSTFAAVVPLGADVINGDNRVEIVLSSRSGRPETIAPTPELFVAVEIEEVEAAKVGDTLETSTRVVTSAEWRPEEDGERQVSLPHRLALAFRARVMGDPAWRSATMVTAGAIDHEALERYRALAAFLAAGNVEAFTNACRLKYQDMSRAYPDVGGAARMREIDSAELRDELRAPGATIPDPATLSPRFVVHANRLVEGIAADGGPLLRIMVPGKHNPVPIQATLAKFGGELLVIR